ncbi:MAG: hypothetical protein ABIH24_10860 [Verrucomicrobiota bacterium]
MHKIHKYDKLMLFFVLFVSGACRMATLSAVSGNSSRPEVAIHLKISPPKVDADLRAAFPSKLCPAVAGLANGGKFLSIKLGPAAGRSNRFTFQQIPDFSQ